MSKSDDRPLSVPEFARLNRISESTAWKLVHSGEVETYKIGGQYRIRRDVAEAIQRPDDDYESAIKKLVDAAPRLTSDQRNRISALLRTGSSAKELARPVKPPTSLPCERIRNICKPSGRPA